MNDLSAPIKTSFSPRQLQILDLISQGKSNKEISLDLKITYGTVKQHLFTIYRMMGVSSRGKVAIVARRILEAQQFDQITSASSKQGYAWRLISAVAFVSSDASLGNPADVVVRNQQLLEFRRLLAKLVQALDGKWMALPDGGALAWFGHPVAHLDDADRACQLAQSMQAWCQRQDQNSAGIGTGIGIGIAAHAEVVPVGTHELISVDVYQLALGLARQSLMIKLPLANALVQRLAPTSIPWLKIKPQKPDQRERRATALVSEYLAIGPYGQAVSNSSHHWDGLPFLKDICAAAQGGIAQWIAVESWPPSVATNLIDAIGNESLKHGFRAVHLRMPVVKQADQVSSYLLAQIETSVAFSDDSILGYSGSNSERLVSAIVKMAEQSPVILQVYGFQALQTLQSIFSDKGVDRLVGSRVIIVAGNLREIGEAQTSIRLLGPRPNKPIFSRVLTMNVPELDLLPEGIRIDLQALLDQLSPTACSLVMSAASSSNKSIEELVLEMKSPRPVIQLAIQELASMGLILPSQGNGFEFRDTATAHAIKQLSETSLAA